MEKKSFQIVFFFLHKFGTQRNGHFLSFKYQNTRLGNCHAGISTPAGWKEHIKVCMQRDTIYNVVSLLRWDLLSCARVISYVSTEPNKVLYGAPTAVKRRFIQDFFAPFSAFPKRRKYRNTVNVASFDYPPWTDADTLNMINNAITWDIVRICLRESFIFWEISGLGEVCGFYFWTLSSRHCFVFIILLSELNQFAKSGEKNAGKSSTLENMMKQSQNRKYYGHKF